MNTSGGMERVGKSAFLSIAVVMALLAMSSLAMAPGTKAKQFKPARPASVSDTLEAIGPVQPAPAPSPISPTSSSIFGHPREQDLDALLGAAPRATPLVQLPDDPPDAPLVSGAYINFESPAVKPVALSSNGARLFVANTPNNRLEIYDTTTVRLTKLAALNVGLEPVAVAVQPGTADRFVWVANHLSDNVTVVDTQTSAVVGVVEVGDEPVNILFNAAGTFAFVIIQGAPAVADPTAPTTVNVVEGAVVAVSTTAPFNIVRSKYLDMNTPRAAVYDASANRLIVAALHSGNNTTVAGEPTGYGFVPALGACCQPGSVCTDENVFDCFTLGGEWLGIGTDCMSNPCPNPINPMTTAPSDPCGCNCNCVSLPNILIPVLFTNTFAPTPASIFNGGGLAPFPDVWVGNPTGPAGPWVMRIVEDAGVGSGDWTNVVASILNGGTIPDATRVTDLETQFPLKNGFDILTNIVTDAKDTADRDVVVVDVSNPGGPNGLRLSRPIANVGTTLTGMALNPVNGDVYVSNLEPRNLERLEPTINGRFMKHEIVVIRNIYTSAPLIQRFDLHASIPGFDNVSAANPTAMAGSLANPMDLAVSANGQLLYLAAFGVSRVAVLSTPGMAVLSRTDVGNGPRALALDAAQNRLFTFNRTDMSVTDLSVANPAAPMIRETKALFNPEPPVIRNGRDFLYSTRSSNNFGSSCGMCHIDGNLDHLAWDLGDPGALTLLHTPFVNNITPCGQTAVDENHPLKGPMVTLSLKGLDDHTELHWRGDKEDFNAFNGAFSSLLGGNLSATKMQAFTDFINTVVYPPNYYRTHDNQFKNPAAISGRSHFVVTCDGCHMLSHDGAFADPACIIDGDDGAFNLSGLFAQIQLVPQLRSIHKKFNSDKYNGFGLIHDGREEREANAHPLETFLQNFFPGISTPPLSDETIAFVTAFQTNVMPVVGWQILWDDPTTTGQDMIDILQMIHQNSLAPSRCDVIMKVPLLGVMHGAVLTQLSPPMFTSDLGTMHDLTNLSTIVAGGTPIVVTAVPPGSGTRIGIDQDLDGILDGFDTTP